MSAAPHAIPPLAVVVDNFVSELDEIESIFAVYRGHRSVSGVGFSYVPGEDGCLVSLWDAWTRFLRRLVMHSSAGPVLGLGGGTHTPPTPRTEVQVLADLAANRRGNDFGITNGEPKWSDPRKLASVCSYLVIANAATIINSVTSSFVTLGPVTVTNPLEEVRICRNYVAHKAAPTLSGVHEFAIGNYTDLSTHMRQHRSGVEAFSEWHDCFVALAKAAAQ